jgi:hypothetical protein
MNKLLLLGLSCLFLCQCKTVKISGPVPNPPLKHLAVVNNEDVHMDDFQSEMVGQIRAMGINTTVVHTPPGKADYLTYTAIWRWDLGMYLRRFKATLHRPQTPLRSVVYENTGLDFSKFGDAPDKIRSPMRQFLLGSP